MPIFIGLQGLRLDIYEVPAKKVRGWFEWPAMWDKHRAQVNEQMKYGHPTANKIVRLVFERSCKVGRIELLLSLAAGAQSNFWGGCIDYSSIFGVSLDPTME